MNYGIHLKATGDYALFSRPEMKVERVSYDVMTPSAARGILEAIYWKPQIRWIIDEIHVLNPIRFTNIRRNEVASKIPVQGGTGVNAAMRDVSIRPAMDVAENRQQRASLLLKDVAYLIKAHVHILDPRLEKGDAPAPENEAIGKHLDMFKRRARKGQAFHQPYFGCREFPVRFELIENEAELPSPHDSLAGEKDLGFMLHDIEFEQDRATKKVRSTIPHFFRATMTDGIITVPALPFAI
ncbi:type I-C CRISPR-associated protein Cas5c [Haloferula sargassicola]|uniref:pre-crRNA processing endonuclease n=1 Tax=Haloferula sargassicola TaxID=490096 RepID=A0ABP9UHY0_9BACT